MLINEGRLRRLIRKFLFEITDTDWSLIDDIDDETDVVQERYSKYADMLELAKKKIKDEAIEKNTDISKFSKFIDNTQLVMIDEFRNNQMSAEVLHFAVLDGKILKMAPTPGMPDNIVMGIEHYKSWSRAPVQNPIVIVGFNQHPSARVVDVDLMYHEVGHVKNQFLDYMTPGFNVKAVIEILRDDLIGKSNNEVVSILINDGFFKEGIGAANARRFLNDRIYLDYIDTVKGDASHIDIDELSQRVIALQRSNKFDEIMRKIKNKELLYDRAIKDYNYDIAQIIPLLKKSIKFEDIQKVVKIEKEKESVIV